MKRVFLFAGDPFSAEDLDFFVKKKIGMRCYVSSVPKSINDPVGIGVVREETAADGSGSLGIKMRECPDVFMASFRKEHSGLFLEFPGEDEVHKQFMKYAGANPSDFGHPSERSP